MAISLFGILGTTRCTIKAPPITFTQTQTASEKQMIGEDKEIEKDGWLISSIKSSSSGSDLWRRNTTASRIADKNFIMLQRKLAYLEPELREYKQKGILGESFDGTVKVVPKWDTRTSASIQRVEDIAKNVNSARKEIILIQAEQENSPSPEELVSQEVKLRFQYLEYGEYFESSKNNWEKKE